MRFLFLASTFPNPNEGASGCDLSTIEALRALGHHVDDFWMGGRERRIRHDNLHQLLELPGWFRDLMLERCTKAAYDVVHVSVPHGWLAARVHRERRLPGIFVTRSHGWEPHAWAAMAKYGAESRPLWRRAATKGLRVFLAGNNRKAIRYSDGIAVLSEEEVGYLLRHEGADRQRVGAFAPGVPDYFLSPLPEPDSRRFRRVLYVGSHAGHKAPEVVAAIMARLACAADDLELTWVTQERWHPEVRALLGPVASRVRLRGWMPREELIALYDQHGFFLQPSHYEGYCLAFLEAMARGCCVMATNLSGPREKIDHAVNGFLFRPGDDEGIAGTLLGLVGQPVKCLSIAAASRRSADSMTWRVTARKFCDFSERLLAKKDRQ